VTSASSALGQLFVNHHPEVVHRGRSENASIKREKTFNLHFTFSIRHKGSKTHQLLVVWAGRGEKFHVHCLTHSPVSTRVIIRHRELIIFSRMTSTTAVNISLSLISHRRRRRQVVSKTLFFAARENRKSFNYNIENLKFTTSRLAMREAAFSVANVCGFSPKTNVCRGSQHQRRE
jgi:hypothetical protein